MLALIAGLAFTSAALAQNAPTEPEGTETPESTEPAPSEEEALALERLKRQKAEFKQQARRLHRLMGKPRPRLARRPAFETELEYRTWLRAVWKEKRAKARSLFQRPPHLRAWRCIHRYEGPWRDPNAPYYGGLQMDLTFQRMYGRALLRRKGTADRWSPLEQMWVAERALRAGRGFYPWPVTARRCGLI